MSGPAQGRAAWLRCDTLDTRLGPRPLDPVAVPVAVSGPHAANAPVHAGRITLFRQARLRYAVVLVNVGLPAGAGPERQTAVATLDPVNQR